MLTCHSKSRGHIAFKRSHRLTVPTFSHAHASSSLNSNRQDGYSSLIFPSTGCGLVHASQREKKKKMLLVCGSKNDLSVCFYIDLITDGHCRGMWRSMMMLGGNRCTKSCPLVIRSIRMDAKTSWEQGHTVK